MAGGQLVLALEEVETVAAAVWETLPTQVQLTAVRQLAGLMAALIEAERDE